MKVHLPYESRVTVIENAFIDIYMPAANGEFVKIYLYLLRCAAGGRNDLSVSGIADIFDQTEADVRRALNYWGRVGLIALSSDENGALKDIQLLPIPSAEDPGKMDAQAQAGRTGIPDASAPSLSASAQAAGIYAPSPRAEGSTVSPNTGVYSGPQAADPGSASANTGVYSGSRAADLSSASPKTAVYAGSPAADPGSASANTRVYSGSPAADLSSASPNTGVYAGSPAADVNIASPGAGICDGSLAADLYTGSQSANVPAAAPDKEASSKITEFRSPRTRPDAQDSSQRADIRRVLFVAEQYYGRLLTEIEIGNLVYFMDELKMSEDLVEYLIEYCVTKGHKSARYIEKVALLWHEKGIRSVEEARNESRLFNDDYFEIFRAFGIQDRTPADAEIRYMEIWIKDLDMSMDVIKEACSRTILQTSKAQFPYADSILQSWHKSGVHTLADVRRLDEQYEAKKENRGRVKELAPKTAPSRFNNCPSSDYDWDSIGRMVIQSQESRES